MPFSQRKNAKENAREQSRRLGLGRKEAKNDRRPFNDDRR
eukprot:CAMPEP_0172591570 /NCGR_PEP_ID=MMETSP1068-20121228/10396_1 /TAXON_ID=35684 /ORGANISM="Pseudopedinella elastica, Strain CCMP716" /LENGTH=39 /DNA_ID= /DNA_START= /DNA_END= /DNA_ORIENTATION=